MAEQDQYDAPLTPLTVGERLRAAREAVGLSRADVAARTKIAERHLGAIEEDRFDDLASSTYAVGFARAYARTVGLDEAEIARLVRGRLDAGEDEVRPAVAFEPGDPARIPTPRLAWLAAAGVVAVMVAIFLFWRSYYTPAVTLPDLTKDEVAPPVVTAAAPAALPSVTVGVPLGVATSAAVPAPSVVASGAARLVAVPPARPASAPARPTASPSPQPLPRPSAAPSPRVSASPPAERPATPPAGPASPAPAAQAPAAAPPAAAEQASTVSQ